MFMKKWENIKRGLALLLSASLIAGSMSVSGAIPVIAAEQKNRLSEF